MRQKRAFTLMEILISLGLLTLLLSSLFSIYSFFFSEKALFLRQKEQINEQRFIFSRLKNLLSHASLPLGTYENGNGIFFIFDRGVHSDPLLANEVLAGLYLDKKEAKLCLSLWPKPEKEKIRKEPSEHLVLVENVEKISFSFYSPMENPSRQFVNPEKIDRMTPPHGWQSTWLPQWNKFPALLELTVTREGKEEKYLFDFAHPITFLPEKIET